MLEDFYNSMDATAYAFDNKINFIKESEKAPLIRIKGKPKGSQIPKGTYDDLLNYKAEEGDLFGVEGKTYKYSNGKWVLVMNYLIGSEDERTSVTPYEGLKFYQNSDDPSKRGQYMYTDDEWILTQWIGTQAEYDALTEVSDSAFYILTDLPEDPCKKSKS